MSDYGTDFEDFEDDEDTSPAGLRKALAKAKAAAKKANERATAAEERASKAETSVKKSTLTDILGKAGVKPGIARFLEQDNVEPTKEAVDAWLKENGEFFNVKPAEASEESGDEQEQQGEGEQPASRISAETQTALQQSQQLDASGIAPAEVGVLQRIQSISNDPSKLTWEQLVEELKAAGAPMA